MDKFIWQHSKITVSINGEYLNGSGGNEIKLNENTIGTKEQKNGNKNKVLYAAWKHVLSNSASTSNNNNKLTPTCGNTRIHTHTYTTSNSIRICIAMQMFELYFYFNIYSCASHQFTFIWPKTAIKKFHHKFYLCI